MATRRGESSPPRLESAAAGDWISCHACGKEHALIEDLPILFYLCRGARYAAGYDGYLQPSFRLTVVRRGGNGPVS